MGVPPFKTPTLNKGMLQAAEIMRDGYPPKMLLYTLDELFFVYAQIRDSPRDERVVLAYEILCILSIRCTGRWNRVEQMGVPDALALLNTEDARHLECLAWAIYDGALLVGHGQNFLALGPGAQCWWGCSDTSIGATMTRLIVRHRHLVPGIMKNGCRHCVAWAASVDENGHHSPVGGLEAALFNAFRCQCMTDNHRLHLPTRPRDVHMRQHYSLFLPRGVTAVPWYPMTPPLHRKWSQWSMFPPMPGPATQGKEPFWLRSTKRRCWKMTSKHSIHLFAM